MIIISSGDLARDKCGEEAVDSGFVVNDDGSYKQAKESVVPIIWSNIDECISWEKKSYYLAAVIRFFIYIPLRIWFAINMKHWRDELIIRERMKLVKAAEEEKKNEMRNNMDIQVV